MDDRIADVWGRRTPYRGGGHWPVREDSHLADGVDPRRVQWVPSACVLCSNGCGCDIAVLDGRMVGVRGRVRDRVNHGRLGPKGLYGSWQAQSSPDRLTVPLLRQGGRLVETDWDTAMDRIAAVSRALLDDKGPLSHGFYTSGQLFLEEYYTLAVIGKAGLGTPHMDGNTRLCTATSAAALKESFGCDGQPGSYTDVDHADAIFLYGHNVAETQTVLWSRILDRIEGPDRPRIVCVDPRRTAVAQAADLHLPVRPGTNLALLNAIVHELIAADLIDHDYVRDHTSGFAQLRDTVASYGADNVAELCGVPADDIRRAAHLFGTTGRVLSTVLQGFYQSHQATAASCQVNNLHLLRGMLGRPGCGVLQMNGQPTAENTRECGADGDLPGFRNWADEEHIAQLAKLWNVDPLVIPHWSPPTHAMQIFRYAEQGSIRLLWISGTNPAVSLPDLARIRAVLGDEKLFVIVSDCFLTETAQLADVVLPAAMWGEKTGTFTNTDRSVHLSLKAVDPPGQARSDLDAFCEYARRMDLRDRDGAPLIGWSDPEGAFAAWRECSRGRPCDYTGLSYQRLRHGPVQWPCNDEHPDGQERLYGDGVFPTALGRCEEFGHDLLTGAAVTPEQYRALRIDGRARLRAADYVPGEHTTTEEHPLLLTTGRTAYHFHTRTKTARAPELNRAAPRPWVEVSAADARRLDLREGDTVRVESATGHVDLPVRVTDARPGTVFIPFHYGYWDTDSTEPRAANELTATAWDPVSKQPHFKLAAVRLTLLARGDQSAPPGGDAAIGV
ncbi:nitrate reductase [Catellatospora sp. KI3]|uniref:molybdopterin oxidoreductase family protein n=1 Tax=Catellatospora sp. KI3 TaxID=3041620 RepID=UPI002482C8C8|nr:nitrate reductase [Catellatospora sp. KI3]MDI1460694.1 nitrate reductase [Catellatospora sp. KI3]